jgi:predicted nucleotidyltransferase
MDLEIFSYFCGIKQKTMSHTDLLHQIRQIGRQVLPEDAHLLIYGSRARGDYRENSDWDLLVLLNRPQEASDFQNIAYPIIELGFDLGEYFSVQTYSQQEWEAIRFLPYYKNVEQDKTVSV